MKDCLTKCSRRISKGTFWDTEKYHIMLSGCRKGNVLENILELSK